VTDLSGARQALEVFQDAWGNGAANDFDTYFAAARHGAYLGLGLLSGEPVVAAFGLLSVDPITGRRGLHSHMTATKRSHANSGLGYAMKSHQREWARSQEIEAITWTFDPLQRRNARFNLVRLGAQVIGFYPNLYGRLSDAINEGVDTDRFEVRWPVTTSGGSAIVAGLDDVVLPLPESIDHMRLTDPELARLVQADLRRALGQVEDGTLRVRGMTADHSYVLSRKS
jgi:predicted GNAT superfamily acetyltransferase